MPTYCGVNRHRTSTCACVQAYTLALLLRTDKNPLIWNWLHSLSSSSFISDKLKGVVGHFASPRPGTALGGDAHCRMLVICQQPTGLATQRVALWVLSRLGGVATERGRRLCSDGGGKRSGRGRGWSSVSPGFIQLQSQVGKTFARSAHGASVRNVYRSTSASHQKQRHRAKTV